MTTGPKTRTRYSYRAFEQAVDLDCVRATSQTIGISMRTIHRWQNHGIPESMADHVAIAFGLHPANIWPEQWWGTSHDT